MNDFYVRLLHTAAIFKMAGVPTEFLDRRQWQHMKRSVAANSLSSNTMNDAIDSQEK